MGKIIVNSEIVIYPWHKTVLLCSLLRWNDHHNKCISTYFKRLQTIVDHYLTLFDPMVAAMARGANKSTRLRILKSLTSTWRGGGGIKVDEKKAQDCGSRTPIILGKTSLLPWHDWICYLWCEKAVGFWLFWGFIDKLFLSQKCLLYIGQDLWESKRHCPVSRILIQNVRR